MQEVLSHSSEETIARGRELALSLHPPLLILLSGDLGAGKTTFAKGIISGLGAANEEEVTSPTFTLVHAFTGRTKAFHVDLYRISAGHDFDTLGLEDLFTEPAIVLVEWPDRMHLRTDWPVLQIRFEHVDDNVRRIKIEPLVAANFFPEKLANNRNTR